MHHFQKHIDEKKSNIDPRPNQRSIYISKLLI
jgi:hypothetical protein